MFFSQNWNLDLPKAPFLPSTQIAGVSLLGALHYPALLRTIIKYDASSFSRQLCVIVTSQTPQKEQEKEKENEISVLTLPNQTKIRNRFLLIHLPTPIQTN